MLSLRIFNQKKGKKGSRQIQAPHERRSASGVQSSRVRKFSVKQIEQIKRRGRCIMYDNFNYKGEWRPYFTYVLDMDKLEKRIKFENSLGIRRVTRTEIFRRIGYSKSYACLLANADKYGFIEPSARMIATMVRYLGLTNPLEMFSLVMARKINSHQQTKALGKTNSRDYLPVSSFVRHTEDEEHNKTFFAR